MKKKVLLVMIRWFLWHIALLWCRSLRITRDGAERFDGLRDNGKNYVVAFWHGSMLLGWYLHRPAGPHPVSALVSQSSDGEYLSSFLERWGYSMIRGSSHIGGKEAMSLMVDAVTEGNALAITPDGPRGPRHEMKMGAVRIAQRTQVPLILAGIAIRNKKLLRSWDRFEVPMPFSSVAAVYSEPMMIPAGIEGAPLDDVKLEMQERLKQLTHRAEQLASVKGGRS